MKKVLNAAAAQALIEAKGEVVIKVSTFTHPLEWEEVECYAVSVESNPDEGYIIRSDTGAIFRSREFWRAYSLSGGLPLPPFPSP